MGRENRCEKTGMKTGRNTNLREKKKRQTEIKIYPTRKEEKDRKEIGIYGETTGEARYR